MTFALWWHPKEKGSSHLSLFQACHVPNDKPHGPTTASHLSQPIFPVSQLLRNSAAKDRKGLGTTALLSSLPSMMTSFTYQFLILHLGGLKAGGTVYLMTFHPYLNCWSQLKEKLIPNPAPWLPAVALVRKP